MRDDQREQFFDQDRREPERRLVENKKPRLGHQPAADGQHLLFAAGERSGPLGAALAKPRENGEHALAILGAPRGGAPITAEVQIVVNRQVRE